MNNNNNNNNEEGNATGGVVKPEGYNTSGRTASNIQGLEATTPNIVSRLTFSTPAVHRAYGSASRSAVRPLGSFPKETGGTSAQNSLNGSENVLDRVAKLHQSAFDLLVQLTPSLVHFHDTLANDPTSHDVLKQSVIFVISKSDSLQLECSRYIDAIDEFDATAFDQFGTTEDKILEKMRQATMLSLRDSGALKPKLSMVSSSTGAQYTEVVVQSSPFQLSFRIACDQNAISRDKADASENSAVKAAVAKALTSSGIEIAIPISATVGTDGALQQLLVLFHALSTLAMEERVTEMKLIRLINWALAGDASVHWSATARGDGSKNGTQVALEDRLLAFIERYSAAEGAVSGLKDQLCGLRQHSGEMLLSFVNRMNIFVAGTDGDMQRIALEDLYRRIDPVWKSLNQLLHGKFVEKQQDCYRTRREDVDNPWHILHHWVVTSGISEDMGTQMPHQGLPADLDANQAKERDTQRMGSASTTQSSGKGAFRSGAGSSGSGGARSGAGASGSTGKPGSNQPSAGKRNFTEKRVRYSQSKDEADLKGKSDAAKFAGNCFYCQKAGHRQLECRSKARDEKNGIVKTNTDVGSAGVDSQGNAWNVLVAHDMRVRTQHKEVTGIATFVDSVASRPFISEDLARELGATFKSIDEQSATLNGIVREEIAIDQDLFLCIGPKDSEITISLNDARVCKSLPWGLKLLSELLVIICISTTVIDS